MKADRLAVTRNERSYWRASALPVAVDRQYWQSLRQAHGLVAEQLLDNVRVGAHRQGVDEHRKHTELVLHEGEGQGAEVGFCVRRGLDQILLRLAEHDQRHVCLDVGEPLVQVFKEDVVVLLALAQDRHEMNHRAEALVDRPLA
ncbi:hypothetical protein FQZ97_730310 [compost metagenome]